MSSGGPNCAAAGTRDAASASDAMMSLIIASLPISIDFVPLLDPWIAQLDVLLEIGRPRLDHFGIVTRRIERRIFQRREVAELLDLEFLALFGHAPVEEQLGGVRIRRRFRHARGVVVQRNAI